MSKMPPSQQQQQPSRGGSEGQWGRVRFRDDDAADKPLRSVVVTLWGGGSYDELFRRMPQEIPDGRASVWQFQPDHFALITRALAGAPLDPAPRERALVAAVEEMAAEVAQVPPENVVINWECCAAWSERWPDREAFASLCRKALDRRHLLMLSDFSMKSLIRGWDPSFLGPNPFVEVGAVSDRITLAFDAATLAGCESVQLRLLGELCGAGGAVIHAMSNTIVFSVDRRAADTDRYRLEVLTLATNALPADPGAVYELGQHRGTVGHALLHYPSGGRILCSGGHWIELQRLDVSEEALLGSAERQYGRAYRAKLEQRLAEGPAAARAERVQQLSQAYVQQSSPTSLKKG